MLKNRSRQLLEAVDDLIAPYAAPPVHELHMASTAHRAYFARYVNELRAAKRVADDWMERIIQTEAERIGDRAEAEKNISVRRPSGAVVYPYVVHCIRKAWLTCQQLNDEMPTAERVAPQAFVLSWLDQAAEYELSAFVATLPFWPMGLDDDDRWV